MEREKPIVWIGSSYRDVSGFPAAARRAAGHNLSLVQNGLEPDDFKPMASVGPGAYEVRVQTVEDGSSIQHRVFYVARFEEAVYVLHAFQKKTQKTSRHDLEVGKARYREMIRDRQDVAKQKQTTRK